MLVEAAPSALTCSRLCPRSPVALIRIALAASSSFEAQVVLVCLSRPYLGMRSSRLSAWYEVRLAVLVAVWVCSRADRSGARVSLPQTSSCNLLGLRDLTQTDRESTKFISRHTFNHDHRQSSRFSDKQ